MPRPSPTPVTQLSLALIERRAGRAQRVAGAESGVPHTTLSRLERGAHRPSWDTAVALAAWLGWTPGQVMDAAATRLDAHPESERSE